MRYFLFAGVIFLSTMAFCMEKLPESNNQLTDIRDDHVSTIAIMPMPAKLHLRAGQLPIIASFSAMISGGRANFIEAEINRLFWRWQERTGLSFKQMISNDATSATLLIECKNPGESVITLREDESYNLNISLNQVTLSALTTIGILRGLQTLSQLLTCDANGWFLPVLNISDQPRFPWRGLLIDVCRHWQPIEVIKRNIDGMAVVKLNVLHLHLTEDQGFRIESKKYPRLHLQGSDGNYFTQEQMREIISYAAARGIRVVPEFDIPGHVTSWLVGYPELASQPGPYEIERKWGIKDPVLDPTNEEVYTFLDGFLGEMAELFPDAYVHIGGDENNGKHWNNNPKIQAFIAAHDLKDNAGLQAYFNQRVSKILAKYGKKMIGWDEILHPDLPKDTVIHSWRGYKSLEDAARQGYSGILSHDYYIDHCKRTNMHYLNEPFPAKTSLTVEHQQQILGGEATMWSEWVTPETIDSRIWPRTAAIAERLWSPNNVTDVADMYRRLDHISRRLEEAGLLHKKNPAAMIRRLIGDHATVIDLHAFHKLVEMVEPVKRLRNRLQPDITQSSPLTDLADCAQPDSKVAREFAASVKEITFRVDKTKENIEELKQQLETWRDAGQHITETLVLKSPRLRQYEPLARALVSVSEIGIDGLDGLNHIYKVDHNWVIKQLNKLKIYEHPFEAVELALIPAVKLIIAAVSGKCETLQYQRKAKKGDGF